MYIKLYVAPSQVLQWLQNHQCYISHRYTHQLHALEEISIQQHQLVENKF